MITELNIYVALLVAFLLLTFSIRLGISLYQSK
jgi:photosystem I reaction center subunit XII